MASKKLAAKPVDDRDSMFRRPKRVKLDGQDAEGIVAMFRAMNTRVYDIKHILAEGWKLVREVLEEEGVVAVPPPTTSNIVGFGWIDPKMIRSERAMLASHLATALSGASQHHTRAIAAQARGDASGVFGAMVEFAGAWRIAAAAEQQILLIPFERHAARGMKQLRGASKGGLNPSRRRLAGWSKEQIAALVEEKMTLNSHLSKTEAIRRVAEELAVASRTIERYLKK